MSCLNGDRVERPTRPLVIGVGNRFRGDDGVAGVVLDTLAAMVGVVERADLIELDGEPTRLVDAWEDRMRVAVVDAVHAPDMSPGELVVLSGSDALDPVSVARWSCGVSGHSAGLGEALRLGSVMQRLPAELCVVGVVAASLEYGTELTQPVAAAVPGAVAAVIERLGLSVGTEREGLDHVPV
jgi:hydrogenase maturation protease